MSAGATFARARAHQLRPGIVLSAGQVAITAEFGKQASKAVGDYAGAKLKEAQNNND